MQTAAAERNGVTAAIASAAGQWRRAVSNWVKAGAVAFVAWSAWTWWHDRPVEPAAGVIAPEDPVQDDVASDSASIEFGRWKLQPRASYAITARVLSRENYSIDDFASASPVDLALGWGVMSDSATLRSLSISQGARFYSVHWSEEPPAAPQELMGHSANTHTIPANAAIAKRLRSLRAGQVVRLEGVLVDGARDDGWTIRTSLRRDDTGAGACEVLYVERVDVVAGG